LGSFPQCNYNLVKVEGKLRGIPPPHPNVLFKYGGKIVELSSRQIKKNFVIFKENPGDISVISGGK
jgi:hypothetical protein